MSEEKKIEQLDAKMAKLLSVLERTGDMMTPDSVAEWLAFRDLTVKFDVVNASPITNHSDGLNALTNEMYFGLRTGLKGVTKEAVADSIMLVALNNKFNPWLDTLPEWDGEDHYDSLLSVFNADEKPEGLREWLYSIAGMQLYRDRLETDTSVWRPQMLLLVGEQGKGKDWFYNGVARGFVNQCAWDGLVEADRDELRRAKRCVICSIGEDPTAHGRATESVKRFLTLTKLKTRAMYERFDDKDDALLSAFGGSTNEYSPLRDMTGNRRFCVINVDKKRKVPVFDFDQLMSQMVYEVKQIGLTNGYPWVRYDYADNEARNARYVAIPDLFSDLLEQAVFEAPIKTLAGIRDAIVDTDARRFYLSGRNLSFGLQRLGYRFNGKEFVKAVTNVASKTSDATGGGATKWTPPVAVRRAPTKG